MYPHVLRRVGGYNLDVYAPQSVRPYTSDGSVNLAHLLVGSEGTLAYFSRITLQLARLPAHRVLGVVNFASFRSAMESTQHIVKLEPTAVELVDRTMIDLARGNPAFRAIIDRALIGEPEAILLVEFAGGEAGELVTRLDRLVELLGDLGMRDAVVRMTAPQAQKELWEVRKAGLNIMMSMKGDGKPVSFIEDCAVPLEHLGEYTERLSEVFRKHGTTGTWYAHASVGTLHVRPILDMRRQGATQMRAIAEEAAAMVREYKGAYSGEHGDGLCRGEWVAWQFGPRLNSAFAEIKALFDPTNRMNPGKIVAPPKMDDTSLFRFPPAYRRVAIQPKLDWIAMGRRTRSTHRPRDQPRYRRRSYAWSRQGCRDVQQQRSLPQVRCRDDVPELSRHARRATHDARACEYAASGALRPARRRGSRRRRGACGAGSVRIVQGLQARMSHRRRHGQAQDRSAGSPRRPPGYLAA